MLSEFPVNAYGRCLGSFQIIWAVVGPINQLTLKIAQFTRASAPFGGYPLILLGYASLIIGSGLCAMVNMRKYTEI